MTRNEQLAILALHAWNNIPPGTFEWPRDFPEGSREAWRRVVAAIAKAERDRCIGEASEVLSGLQWMASDAAAHNDKRQQELYAHSGAAVIDVIGLIKTTATI